VGIVPIASPGVANQNEPNLSCIKVAASPFPGSAAIHARSSVRIHAPALVILAVDELFSVRHLDVVLRWPIECAIAAMPDGCTQLSKKFSLFIG
jgi:hypothetical protein